MSKIAHYLQEHLLGEVTASAEVRRHFSNDASVLRMAPAIVVYPRNENDIRKTARFAWQLAQRGRPIPLTARGGGSDTTGGAIGNGIMLVFTAHMNKILSLDPAKMYIVVEPGATYDKIEQTLFTHGLFFPPYPASAHYATIGGGLANGAIGEKSVKYGGSLPYVENLRVVLANGEVINTKRLNKRELNKKMGMATFEGEIYRGLDALLEENAELLEKEKARYKSVFNSVGYNIFDVKTSEGFSLTPLFIGSKGTLGLITEAILEVVPHNPLTNLCLASLENVEILRELIPKILELKPSVFDMLNKAVLAQIAKVNPNQVAGSLDDPTAALHLFIEFDDHKESTRKKKTKQLRKLISKAGGGFKHTADHEQQENIWKLRQSVGTILTQPFGVEKAVPAAEDICVPVHMVADFLVRSADIYVQNDLTPAAWGNLGVGVVRMQPVVDLSTAGGRQKMFKVSEAIYELAIRMGGTISASAGDGRLRAPYALWQHGPELQALMVRIKKIFDPYSILNSGVKTASLDEVKSLMRGEYSLRHHHEHFPRS